jgi:hypothetical protein
MPVHSGLTPVPAPPPPPEPALDATKDVPLLPPVPPVPPAPSLPSLPPSLPMALPVLAAGDELEAPPLEAPPLPGAAEVLKQLTAATTVRQETATRTSTLRIR